MKNLKTRLGEKCKIIKIGFSMKIRNILTFLTLCIRNIRKHTFETINVSRCFLRRKRNVIRYRIKNLEFPIFQKKYSYIRIIILLLAFMLFVWFFPSKIFNPLGISSPDSASTIFNIIAGGLISLLGIFVAVFLVILELLRRSYGEFAYNAFFRNTILVELFILCTFTIIYSLVGASIIENQLTDRTLRIFYVSFIFFIIILFLIYPTFKDLLIKTRASEQIKDLIFQLNLSSFPYISSIEHINNVIDENPIIILSEISRRTIQNDDRFTPGLIISETTKQLLTLTKNMSDGQHRRAAINSLLFLLNTTAKESIHKNNTPTLQIYLKCIESIYNQCILDKAPWYSVVELNESIQDSLRYGLNNSLDSWYEHGIWMLKRIWLSCLSNNCPREEEIASLWRNHKSKKQIVYNTDQELQWNHVASDYAYIIAHLAENAISLRKSMPAGTAIHTFTDISADVAKSSLGPLQKSHIISWCFYWAKSLSLKLVSHGLHKDNILWSPFNSFSIDRILEQNEDYSRIPIEAFVQFLIDLAKKQEFIDDFILNELGTICRCCIHSLDKGRIFRQAALYISICFNKLSVIMCDRVSLEDMQPIISMLDQVKSFHNWFENEKKHDKEIEAKIVETTNRLEGFLSVHSTSDDILEWPK